jgi:hypothetical protein
MAIEVPLMVVVAVRSLCQAEVMSTPGGEPVDACAVLAHPVGDRLLDRAVHRAVGAAAEAHVGHRRRPTGAVSGQPVDAGDYAGPGAAAVAVEHPDRHQGDPFGHAVR